MANSGLNCCTYHDYDSFNISVSKLNPNKFMAALHLNLRSIRDKGDDLREFLENMDISFNVLMFTETWLTQSEKPPQLEGYTYQGITRTNGRGGGVAMYLREHLQYEVISSFTTTNEHIECLTVCLKSFYVCVIYRPPNGNKTPFFEFTDELLNYLTNTGSKFLIMGDLNINMLGNDTNARELKRTLYAYGCENFINLATRITADSATLLDVAITNAPGTSSYAGLLSVDISDHLPIFCFLPMTNDKSIKMGVCTYRNINPNSLAHFRSLIQKTNWEPIFQQSDVNKAYNNFYASFMSCYELAFPIKTTKRTRKKKIRKPWITRALLNKIAAKNNMYHSFVKTRDPQKFAEFKKYRNKLNAELRYAKICYYENLFSQVANDKKKFWQAVNNLAQRKNDAAPIVVTTNQGILNDDEAANMLNHQFIRSGEYSSTVRYEHPSVDAYKKKTSSSNSIVLAPATEHELSNIMRNLKNNAAAGYDDIKPAAVKYVMDIICSPLTHVINCMLEQGVFPEALKLARVCPVHKGGTDYTFNNYRPISVLPVMSKIFETVINVRVDGFVQKYSIMSDVQYGFRKKRSCEEALLSIKHEIINNIEQRLYTIGLFLDLRKAFDSVSHAILLTKIYDCGIRGTAHDLIRSYLQNRYQYVSINNSKSTKLKILQGVPQGSILGPLLFNLYINDLAYIPYSQSVIMYADDTNVFFAGKSLQMLQISINNYLKLLMSWLHSNQLQLNVNKTKYIIFAPINKPINFKLAILFQNVQIEQVEAHKFLGIWFRGDMSWTTHVEKLSAELSKITGCFNKIRDLIPLWLKKVLYYSMFYSRLTYCMLVWGTTYSKNYQKLIILQKRVLRCFENYTGRLRDLRTHDLFIKHNLLKANQMYYYRIFQHIKKNKLYTAKSPQSKCRYSLRNETRVIPKFRTAYGRQHIGYQVPHLINHLSPLDFNTMSKKSMKLYIINHQLEYV